MSNNRAVLLFSMVVLILMIGMVTSQSMAQTVNVTFRCNTSTCLDTLRPNHLVLIQGESKKGTTPSITWSTGPSMTSAGGDYWQTTVAALPGDSIQYKFVTYFSPGVGTFHWSGWDGNIASGETWAGSNRALIVGTKDTVLQLQYFNGGDNTLAQYWRPFAAKPDTIGIYFRVNMGGATFDPATQIPVVFGGAPLGNDNPWTQILQLTRESSSVNSGSFWSGVAYIPKASVTSNVTQQFKFVINAPQTWESTGNRWFTFTTSLRTGTEDTTLLWYYFNDQPPHGPLKTVNVTIRCNTSTCLDTLRPTNLVLIQGESKKGTTPSITWSTGPSMTNVGGDYWQTTVAMVPGDSFKYKFVSYFSAGVPTFHWSGWEGPLASGQTWAGDNRALVVGDNDTVVSLQYFNGWENTVAQYWRPFASKTDTVAVYFRVNMGGASFDPATQIVDVRGGAPMGTDSPWITIVTLTRETNSVNIGSFWSGVGYVPKSSITAGTTQQQFKFVIQPNVWESVGNRSFVFSSTNDTTIHWYYFNDRGPSGPKVTADVYFSLKLDALERSHLFNRALGDKIAITGAKGWPPSTFNFDTEPTMLKMTYDPGIKEWGRVESFTLYPGDAINYKYFISWDSTRIDSTSPNFIRALQLTYGWEEPGVTGGADRRYTYGSANPQYVPGDFGADQQYFNSLHWKGTITKPIQVTFNINMAPATQVATNPGTLFRPGIDTVYIQFDGCFVPVTQGKSMWGTDNRVMLTDLDGDGIYTATYALTPPTLYQLCYRLVYTSPTGEIWNGSGSAIRGRRYYQYVHPTQVAADSAVWPATYSLTQINWMLDNLTIEDPPDLDHVTGVGNGSEIPGSYALYQNFPNPFNPSTMITYATPRSGHVRIGIYNILGQKVASLFDQEQSPGIHSIAWNAQDERGLKLSSGVYILRMQAPTFTQVRKMLLAK